MSTPFAQQPDAVSHFLQRARNSLLICQVSNLRVKVLPCCLFLITTSL